MIGYDLESFWQQTPRTLAIAFDAAAERATNEHNNRAWLAWHTAACGRQSPLKPLKRMLVTKEQLMPKRRRMSMDEEIAAVVAYVRSTGGKVIEKNG